MKYLEYRKSPLLHALYSLVNEDYDNFISICPIDDWKESFSLICAYAKNDQFSILCSKLGQKLEENNDYHNALLCYLASLDVEKTIRLWLNDNNESELSAVQELLQKIVIVLFGIRCQAVYLFIL